MIYSHLFGNRTIHIGSDYIDNETSTFKSYKTKGWEKEFPRCSICSTNRQREEITRFWGPPYHRICISKTFTKEESEAHRYSTIWERNNNFPILHPIGTPRDGEAGFVGPDVWLQHYGCVRKKQNTCMMDLTVLRTCRQVYEEARLIPYHTNVFTFDKSWALARFCGLSLNQLRAEDFWSPTDENPWVSQKKKVLSFVHNYTKKSSVSTFLSQIKQIHIHAAYDHDHDQHDWRIVCAKASEFFTGLKSFNLSIDLTPHGPNVPGLIAPDSILGDGFRAFRSSPLTSVNVDIIDEAWGAYLDDHFFNRSQTKFRTTIAQKKLFAQGIKDHLLKVDKLIQQPLNSNTDDLGTNSVGQTGAEALRLSSFVMASTDHP